MISRKKGFRITIIYKVYLGTKMLAQCSNPGGFPFKSDGDARGKIQIKSPRETNVGMAQA